MLTPRPYQAEAIEAGVGSVKGEESPLTIMATGTGKTIVMAKVVEWMGQQGLRTLIMAHRGLLLDQIHKSIVDWTGITPSREQGNDYADWESQIILATPQSLRGERLSHKPKNIGAIVIDECHRAVTPTMMEVYNHFEDPLKVGYTATADRPDGINLSSVFDSIVYQYSLARGVKEGWLAKIIGRRVTDMEIDLSNLRVNAGDFSESELGELLEEHLLPIAHNVIKETADRSKCLIFLPNVHSSEKLSEMLAGMGQAADYVSGAKGKANGEVFAKFRSGELKYLCSCQLVVEGYDEPSIDTIVMLRPTLSRIVYSQAIGRGTRIAPGKDHCLLLEFTFNSNKHKLVSPYELMGDNLSERVVEKAEARALEGDVDFMAILEYEQEHHYDIHEIVARAMPRDFTFKTFNPLDIGDLVAVDLDKESAVWFQGRKLTGRPTEKQIALLSRFMINSEELTKSTASTLIDGLFQKGIYGGEGFASNKQVTYLRRLYPGQVFPPGLKKAAAGLLITTALEAQNGQVQHDF